VLTYCDKNIEAHTTSDFANIKQTKDTVDLNYLANGEGGGGWMDGGGDNEDTPPIGSIVFLLCLCFAVCLCCRFFVQLVRVYHCICCQSDFLSVCIVIS
jgi:hypothetical protein